MCVTHILFSSFALLPSFHPPPMGDLGSETGDVVVALLSVPLPSALLASKAKLLVLVFSLGVGTVKISDMKTLTSCKSATKSRRGNYNLHIQ